MLKNKFNSFSSTQTLIPLHSPFLSTLPINYVAPISLPYRMPQKINSSLLQKTESPPVKTAVQRSSTTTVTAVITVVQTFTGALKSFGFIQAWDDLVNFNRTFFLEFVAADLDPNTGEKKATIKTYAKRVWINSRETVKKMENKDGQTNNIIEWEIYFDTSFEIPENFGDIGAVLIVNEHQQEAYIKNIVVDGLSTGPLHMTCDSWICPKSYNPKARIFFTDKSYLPSQTPSGLTELREEDLVSVRGNGTGERKYFDRIYDYALYNDLGDPDVSEALARPVLGGAKHPYPRRCRTGRPPTKKDPQCESRSSFVYVPRDEQFSEVKQLSFTTKTVYSGLHALIPELESIVTNSEYGFPNFTAIDLLFDEGIVLPAIPTDNLICRLIKFLFDAGEDILRFEIPALLKRDRFVWFRDAEFGRQTLAGLNPLCIKLVTEWPLMSKLDPKVYGPPESAITTELVEQELKGLCTLEEALKQKLLFILDYNDLLLPYVEEVRELKGTTLYGSRALFFLMPKGTLRPIAIELTRPPFKGKEQWKRVFQPSWDPTSLWLWRLAKAQALAHDAGVHQLVSHWLRTHCSTEPYIIATHRQLSTMHPIYKLLHSHLRYTMKINALARQSLINANGVIEKGFFTEKYSMELSSSAYKLQWQFNLQALPADLINRGMAVEDPSSPHGLKLTIEDYPYANDGLLIWDATKQWVTDYVALFYPEPNLVESDHELQSWWTEIREVGHADKKDEPWWPHLKTPDDLIGILMTIIWVASGHHAAVNFGQYDFGGYFPNRATTARTQMPTEDPSDAEKALFMENPEKFLLESFPSQSQAAVVMATLDVLSNHSPDEEYIGGEIPAYWEGNNVISAAFERYSGELKKIEGIIDARNADEKLLNRTGAGIVPYKLLKPYSTYGVTGEGVPNSISI